MPIQVIGDDIEDVCSRCGDTWHVIMAKIGERIAKVVCKRCGSQHNYRAGDSSVPAQTPSSAKNAGRRVFRRKPTRQSNAQSGNPPPPFDPSKPPRTYNHKEAYQPGERVDHPAFGVGVVSDNPGPGKLEVAFPTGHRTLACAKATSTLERPVAVAVPISDRPPDGRSRG